MMGTVNRYLWTLSLLVLIATLCLGSRCNVNRWTNPETGIPAHPGGVPEVGYVTQTPAEEIDAAFDADGDATDDTSIENDAEITEHSHRGQLEPDENPY